MAKAKNTGLGKKNRPKTAKAKVRKSATKKAPAKRSKSSPRSASTLVSGGHMMTIKSIPDRQYGIIHSIPHGNRQKILRKLIAAACTAHVTYGKDWHKDFLSGHLILKAA